MGLVPHLDEVAFVLDLDDGERWIVDGGLFRRDRGRRGQGLAGLLFQAFDGFGMEEPYVGLVVPGGAEVGESAVVVPEGVEEMQLLLVAGRDEPPNRFKEERRVFSAWSRSAG
jgi:hypothetical protein